MKRKEALYLMGGLAGSMISGGLPALRSFPGDATVKPYPQIDGLVTSDLYEVRANGKKIWTEKLKTSMNLDELPDWFTSRPYTAVQQEIHTAMFEGSGRVKVEIAVAEPVHEVMIRPLSRSIRTKISCNKIEFEMTAPDRLYIEADDLPEICIFAEPNLEEVYQEGDENVLFFGPGIHEPGIITMQDNQILYLAPGSVVYGGIEASGAKNIAITGSGILDSKYQYGIQDGEYQFRQMVNIDNTENIRVEGVTIRNGVNWINTLTRCKNILYENVKVISFGNSGDGINPVGSSDVVIRNCFLRCTDDCIAVKTPESDMIAENITVENNIMVGYAFSDGFTIGFETRGSEIKNVLVRDCDILQSRGGSRVDGHSAFSIVCDGPAVVHNITFDNLRVERAEEKLFELIVTDGKKYGDDEPGNIRDILVKNIDWMVESPISLRGYREGNEVRNIRFENCEVNGRPLSQVVDTVIEKGAYVSGIEIID